MTTALSAPLSRCKRALHRRPDGPVANQHSRRVPRLRADDHVVRCDARAIPKTSPDRLMGLVEQDLDDLGAQHQPAAAVSRQRVLQQRGHRARGAVQPVEPVVEDLPDVGSHREDSVGRTERPRRQHADELGIVAHAPQHRFVAGVLILDQALCGGLPRARPRCLHGPRRAIHVLDDTEVLTHRPTLRRKLALERDSEPVHVRRQLQIEVGKEHVVGNRQSSRPLPGAAPAGPNRLADSAAGLQAQHAVADTRMPRAADAHGPAAAPRRSVLVHERHPDATPGQLAREQEPSESRPDDEHRSASHVPPTVASRPRPPPPSAPD